MCVTYSLFLPLNTYKLGKSEMTFVELLHLHSLRCLYHLMHVKLDVNYFSVGDFLPEWMEGVSFFFIL